MNELNEKELQLTVSKLELGTLITNAKSIKEKVEEGLMQYKTENYSEDNIDEAKKDKALLNKTSKTLNDERIRLEKEFNKPFDEFKEIVKETTDMINQASKNIDVIVKEVEDKAKADKKIQCLSIYTNIIEELFDIVPFDKLFNDKWLNKGTDLETVEKEIKNKKETIRSGLKAIEELHSEFELELKNTFLQDFDITKTIFKNTQLKEQKEALIKTEVKKEEIKQEKVEEMLTKPVKVEEIDPIKTYNLQLIAPLSKQEALQRFLKLNGFKGKNIDTGKEFDFSE